MMKQQRTSISARTAKMQAKVQAKMQAKMPEGYRSRYRAFLDQRKAGKRANDSSNGAGAAAGSSGFKFSQGLINFAIFIALFFGILTLFGFGLARLNRGAKMEPHLKSQPIQKPATIEQIEPPPTVHPSGHADVKSSASPDPRSTISLKKKEMTK